MNVVIERCAGLDVHKKTVVACVRTQEEGRGKLRSRETRTFTTAMKGLEALRAWLGSRGVTDVAMESTGVYWRPVYAVLEGDFRLLLVNARHVKHVPGRKTDVRDSEWIAQLLECGLLKGSFVPPPEIRDLRDLTRLRKTLVEDRTAQVNRVGKILELANVKLASVVSDIMGVTGRRILDAMIGGEEDPKVLASLARGSLRGKRRELAAVVPGLIRDHHRFVLRRHLDLIDELSRLIDKLDMRIVAVTDIPFGAALDLLESIPGVGRRSAEAILAETGDDMSPFPTAGHFASWARLCPGNHESAGKRKRASIGKGNSWLRKGVGTSGVGGRADQGVLLPRPVPPQEGEGRLEEGHRSRPACHPGRNPAHVLDRLHPRGPRPGPLPAPRQGTPPAPPSQATRKDGRQAPVTGRGRLSPRGGAPVLRSH